MERDGPDERRRPRAVLRLVLALAGVAAGVLVAEFGFRALLALRGTPWTRSGADARVRELTSSMSASVPDPRREPGEALVGHVLQPYYGVDLEANVAELAHQAQLFRDGAYDDTFVVVFVGGSVCAITANEQRDRIVAALAADPRLAERHVVVLNQGRGAFKQPQQASLVVYLLALGWRPDVIVSIDGFNEVAIAQQNWSSGVSPLQPMWSGWGVLASATADRGRELRIAAEIVRAEDDARELATDVLADGRTRSAILGHLALRRLAGLHSRWSDAQQRYLDYLATDASTRAARGPVIAMTPDGAAHAYAAAWAECSRSLAGLCAERGITYLHVLQPTLLDAGSKPLTPEEVAVSDAPETWVTGVRRGYPLLREEGARLAADGVPFTDLSLVFQGLHESTYTDMCHFHGRGGELFADAIVTRLLARLPAEIPARRRWQRAR